MKKPIKGQKKQSYSWKQFDKDVDRIAKWVKKLPKKPTCIVAVPNGGLCLGTRLHYKLGIPLHPTIKCYPEDVVLLCDDICDSGDTMIGVLNQLLGLCEGISIVALFLNIEHIKYKPDFHVRETKNWIVFPWEV